MVFSYSSFSRSDPEMFNDPIIEELTDSDEDINANKDNPPLSSIIIKRTIMNMITMTIIFIAIIIIIIKLIIIIIIIQLSGVCT